MFYCLNFLLFKFLKILGDLVIAFHVLVLYLEKIPASTKNSAETLLLNMECWTLLWLPHYSDVFLLRCKFLYFCFVLYLAKNTWSCITVT